MDAAHIGVWTFCQFSVSMNSANFPSNKIILGNKIIGNKIICYQYKTGFWAHRLESLITPEGRYHHSEY